MKSRFEHILVGTDFSEASFAALETTLHLARRHDARITVLHVGSGYVHEGGWPIFMEISWQQAHAEMTQALHHRLERFVHQLDLDSLDVELRVDVGWPPMQLADRAEEWRCDLIVVAAGSAGPLEAFFLGSTAEELVRIARTDVLIVRGGVRETFLRVVIGTDFSPNSDAAVEFAKLLSVGVPAALDVVHVYKDPGEASIFTVASDEDRHRYREHVRHENVAALDVFLEKHHAERLEHHLLTGRASKSLCQHAIDANADLVVVGSHGQGRIRDMFLGSTADRTVRRAPCSVAVVRSTPGEA